MASFVDHVTLHVKAGDGGNGCVSAHREKFKPLGEPDGANGGRGGDVVIEADPQETTLLTYHHAPHQKAPSGTPGAGGMRSGRNGEDRVLNVPVRAVVKGPDGEVLADLIKPGQRFVAARDGQGGLGNAALASPKRKAPGFALLGDAGEEGKVILELKSVADVALVGFPSAGGSSLIAAMSAARPKIADYPFTTLIPNLGVMQAGDEHYTIADVPGLIPGASDGKGLGLEFLRHIERCSVIVHVLDYATFEPGHDPLSNLATIGSELAAYARRLPQKEGRAPLADRPRVIVLNEADVPEAKGLAEFMLPKLSGYPVFIVSAVTHTGLRELSFALAAAMAQAREFVPVESKPRVEVRAKDRASAFALSRETKNGEGFFVVHDDKPERWVRQTDFDNDEAVSYLANRLNVLGIEDALVEAGAQTGAMVVVGPEDSRYIFDWEPSIQTGAELLGPRGTDLRFSERPRASRKGRKAAYHDRMDAKAQAREELQMERESGLWTGPER